MLLIFGVVLGILLFLPPTLVSGDKFDEEEYGVRYADNCELCKIVSLELSSILSKSAGSHDVLETGYSVEEDRKKTKYAQSELRLLEAMDSVCEALLEYNIHKERKDWTRFARGTSETFKTLEGLVAKGVKVDIGIPNELWKKPSAEITHLKTQCESLLEDHEEDIETWYFSKQGDFSLEEFLCRKKFLKPSEMTCLEERGETAEVDKKYEKEL